MNTHDLLRNRWTANLTLLFVTLVWGATFSLTKGALTYVGVFPFLAIRFVIASLALLLGALLLPNVRRSFTRETYLAGTFLGTLLFGGYAFQTLGLTTTTPATAGFLTGLNVVIVPLLAFPILRSIPTSRNFIGAIVAVAGLALLTGVDIRSIQQGDMFVLLCSVFLALQIVYTERYASRLNALALTTVEIIVLTIWCSLSLFLPGSLGSATGSLHTSIWTGFSHPIVWIAILICALPGTAFAYFAQTFFQQSTSSTETAIIFSMEPVFAALIGWLSFHDILTLSGQLGCLLIFLSMWIADPNIRIRRARFL